MHITGVMHLTNHFCPHRRRSRHVASLKTVLRADWLYSPLTFLRFSSRKSSHDFFKNFFSLKEDYGSSMSRRHHSTNNCPSSVVNGIRRRLQRTGDAVGYGLFVTVLIFLIVLTGLLNHPTEGDGDGETRHERAVRSGRGPTAANVLPEPNHDEEDSRGERVGPGELGEPVNISRESLGPEEEKEKFQELFDRNSFNEYASDLISVRRRLSDMRSNKWVIPIDLCEIWIPVFKFESGKKMWTWNGNAWPQYCGLTIRGNILAQTWNKYLAHTPDTQFFDWLIVWLTGINCTGRSVVCTCWFTCTFYPVFHNGFRPISFVEQNNGFCLSLN